MFFLVVNWLKVPCYVVAGLLDVPTVLRVLPIGLLVLPGIAVGRWLVTRTSQHVFDRIVLVMLTLGALDLLLG